MQTDTLSAALEQALAITDPKERAKHMARAVTRYAPTLWRRLSTFHRTATVETTDGPWLVREWVAGTEAEPEGARYRKPLDVKPPGGSAAIYLAALKEAQERGA